MIKNVISNSLLQYMCCTVQCYIYKKIRSPKMCQTCLVSPNRVYKLIIKSQKWKMYKIEKKTIHEMKHQLSRDPPNGDHNISNTVHKTSGHCHSSRPTPDHHTCPSTQRSCAARVFCSAGSLENKYSSTCSYSALFIQATTWRVFPTVFFFIFRS